MDGRLGGLVRGRERGKSLEERSDCRGLDVVEVLNEHGLAWHGLAWHGLARHGLAWHGLARHGLARRGKLYLGAAGEPALALHSLLLSYPAARTKAH